MDDVEANILLAMHRKHMTQTELAAACGLTYDQWRYRMRDPEARLTIGELRKIARKLSTREEWLIYSQPPTR